ncbi:hypothetical protein BDN70DRAFT_883788 [Pholiota conissans]|uniref:Uncharacterized protein n=1 Tax=Pholiota conissans TaxID=109636 RepID=A0A9P5YWW2_9AGAR|nr:hypothetical protein BDN70DRAFT_883788 [Pholiota conissans]
MVRADVLGAIRRMANDLPDLSSSLPTMNDSTDAGYVPPMNRLVDETQSGEHEVPASLCSEFFDTRVSLIYVFCQYVLRSRIPYINMDHIRERTETQKVSNVSKFEFLASHSRHFHRSSQSL